MADARSDLAWDDFRLIKAVADERTLPAAAARLRVDHSTVFRRLREIERRLGVQLFERHRSGYAPTSAGEEVVALAARMDEEITGLTRRIAGRTVSPAGELRVTTNDSLLVHLLTPLFARFRERCKDVRLDIVLANQALNLTKRDADVAIRATDRPPQNLVGRRVATIAWALYGRAVEFPRPKDVREDALLERAWVALGDDLASLNAVKFVREHVAAERVGYRVNTVLGLAEAIGQGIGIGHLPCFIGDTRADLVRLSPLEPGMATDCGSSPIPTCATRRACGCSSTSWPRRSSSSATCSKGPRAVSRPGACHAERSAANDIAIPARLALRSFNQL